MQFNSSTPWLKLGALQDACHGLGIVDTNELNSYLTIVAIDENIESGEEEEEKEKEIYLGDERSL